MPPKHKQKKERNKLYVIKIEQFYGSKDIIKKVKTTTECVRIFANLLRHIGLVLRINKELSQLNIKKTNVPI